MLSFISLAQSLRGATILQRTGWRSSNNAKQHHRYNSTKPQMVIARKSAAALIIGDEILSGKTLDTNTKTLAEFLVSHGIRLEKTETIRDEISTIARSVRQLSKSHDMVFTSGGIGPTLDDMTYAGIAEAFSLPLCRHEETLRKMKEMQPDIKMNAARLQMATLPNPCDIFWTQGLWVPLVCVENTYILPGIPRLFSKMLSSIPQDRLGNVRPRARRVVLCDMRESDLADVLIETSKLHDVAIGSYPATTAEARETYRTMVTIEGDEEDEVCVAGEIIRKQVDGRFDIEMSNSDV